MFTGLVEEVGIADGVQRIGERMRLVIRASRILDDLAVDHSVSVSGACLTVVRIGAGQFEVDAVAETLERTTLGELRAGDRVNLERALRLSDRLGGHIVQGHVDGIGRIVSFDISGGDGMLSINIPEHLLKYVIPKGSIAIDGISLTVAAIAGRRITLAVIPHTLHSTTLNQKSIGSKVNIEVDVLGKYIEKLIQHQSRTDAITEDRLRELGYQ